MKILESYTLYLEGLANEVQHILQRCRRERNFAVMDEVDVGLVQNKSDKLTSALLLFGTEIAERVRIIRFSPNPLPNVKSRTCNFVCPFGHTYVFDIYMITQNQEKQDENHRVCI